MVKALQAQQMHVNDLTIQPSATTNLGMIETYYLSFSKCSFELQFLKITRWKS